MSKLKPCPFCGYVEVTKVFRDDTWYYVICDKCGACGPADLGKSGAIEAWNERKEPKSHDEVLNDTLELLRGIFNAPRENIGPIECYRPRLSVKRVNGLAWRIEKQLKGILEGGSDE